MSLHDEDRILEWPEYERISDVAEQMDLLAYLVSHAADRSDGTDQRPRKVDLHLPHRGLESLLRGWSDALLAALEVTDQTIPYKPMPSGPAKRVKP